MYISLFALKRFLYLIDLKSNNVTRPSYNNVESHVEEIIDETVNNPRKLEFVF